MTLLDIMEEDDIDRPLCSFVCGSNKQGDFTVGVAVLSQKDRSGLEDKKKFKIDLYEFLDCAQLTNLESVLIRASPSICHYESLEAASKIVNKRRVENLLEITEVAGKPSKSFGGGLVNIQQDIMTLSGEELVEDLPFCMKALAGLIKEERLIEDTENHGRYKIEVSQLNQYARLDAAAIDALNLLPGKGVAQVESSVFGLLNRCVTKNIGSRLLKRWIRQPLIVKEDILSRQRVITALKEDTPRREAVRTLLRGVTDLSVTLGRFERNSARLEEMYELYLFASRLPELATALSEDGEGGGSTDDLKKIGSRIMEFMSPERCGKYIRFIESVLDMRFVPREFRIQAKHDATGGLGELYNELAEIEAQRDSLVETLLDNELHGMTARMEDNSQHINTYGWHLRVNKKDDNALSKVKTGHYLAVVTATIRWTTNELTELYSQYTDCRAKIDRVQAKLVKEASGTAKTFVPLFEAAASLVAQVDVFGALAHVAAYSQSGYCLPKVTEMGSEDAKIKLVQARHPCLECIQSDSFIPNDYEMNKGDFFIVTGPNMGGKSTYIRQLGTIMVMCQIGSYVPCDEAELPIVDAILARVGASDKQLKGLSTFMAEMVEASAIVETATSNSVVIIDELGRGTSTHDGFGLAWAISEHFASKSKPFGLFATHFFELTSLANELPNVHNKHVLARPDEDKITMLYTVLDGPCKKSFGINIAKMAGFPEDVVDVAKTKAKHLEALTLIDVDNNQTEKLVQAFAGLTKEQAADTKQVQQLIDDMFSSSTTSGLHGNMMETSSA